MHQQHHTTSEKNKVVHDPQIQEKTSIPPAPIASPHCNFCKGEGHYASTCEAKCKADSDLRHQKRNFGSLTACSGALMPAVLLLPLGVPVLSGRQDATWPERWHPGLQILGISDPFWAFLDKFVAPGGALMPAIWNDGVWAPTVKITTFQIVTLPLRTPVAPEALEASYLPC